MTVPVRVDLLQAEDLPFDVGRYRLQEVIGEGGMGRVYRAELLGPSGFRKQCALKVVRLDATHADVARDAFINEARLGGLLNHPNVVATLDFGQLDDLPFIAMELVDGVTLDRLIRKVQGGLPRAVALDAAIQTCTGLDHAHNLNDDGRPAVLVHRDLKPSNIIVSRHGLAKVMDFGIAKANDRVGEHTRTGMTKGTPNYMSPEQIDGEVLDRRSDIFAMGALLYIMLVGQHLFAKRSGGMLSILLAISRVEEMLEDGQRLAIVDELVPGLGPVVRRCLRFDPANRYASARELATDLKRVRASLPEQATLAEFMDQIYGEEEPAQDRSPLYRLSTDTRGARARAADSPPASWEVDDATSNPTQVPDREETFAPPPVRREPASDSVPTAVNDVRPAPPPRRSALPRALGLLALIVVCGGGVGLGIDRVRAQLHGKETPTHEAPTPTPPDGATGRGDILADADVVTDPDEGQETEPPREQPTPTEGVQEVENTTEAPMPPPVEDDATASNVTAEEPASLELSAVALPTHASAGFSKIFQVRLTGAEDAEVSLLVRTADQDWRLHHMEHGAGATWSTSLEVTPEMVGACEFYFQAQRRDDRESRVFLGSRDAPFYLQVM